MPREKRAYDEDGVLPLDELREAVAKADTLVGLYEKRANSAFRGNAELEAARHEMRVMKQELLSELARAKALLQKAQLGLEG
ncbi:hypothetical protein HYU18_01925 [Candidatus Woesearchaeota archaeon]|nr:hypothetical protein [Candidatus Woesearchaeota archaeon]